MLTAALLALLAPFQQLDCEATQLELTGQALGVEGARAVAQLLKGSRLHTLLLARCELGDDGIAALAEGLKGNECVLLTRLTALLRAARGSV